MTRFTSSLLLGAVLLFANSLLQAQSTGTLRGTVTAGDKHDPVHHATVFIIQTGQHTETDEAGHYEFRTLAPGPYDVLAKAPALGDLRRSAQVAAGGEARLDFNLRLAIVTERVNVTATGQEQSTLESFQTVDVLDPIDLSQKPVVSLGDALDGTPGVAKRSFGPGNSRPVIRGFDGDRVLIMQNGISTGSLSSQSGDHGELMDLMSLDRLEVVKGPATLLYGSNAIGGVVNAISAHGEVHDHPLDGFSGYVTGTGGSANALGGGAAGFQYGIKNWMFWGDGGGQRSGDYSTPAGDVFNSFTQDGNGGGGFGYTGEHAFLRLGGGYERTKYGIPPAGDETVALHLRRYNGRVETGVQNLESFVNSFRVKLDYSDYKHEEIPIDETVADTTFFNKIFSYRGVFEERPAGRLSGRFGFSGMRRDYTTVGEEAIAPHVDLNNFAVFTLQEVGFEKFRLQFGGRVDHTAYDVASGSGLPNRGFTGFSGAAGIHVPVWKGGAFVANYTHSYRAPALEELYNNGPHPGNATFEVGNPNLRHEQSDGFDLSLRQQSDWMRAEANVFYYHINDFVFLAPTGDVEDGLPVANYSQGNSRFVGGEANFSVSLARDFWLNTGLDMVNAELTGMNTPLPRIPPVRGRIGLDYRWKGLSVRPEAVMASAQDSLFPTETRTAGYTVFNLGTSYTVARAHAVHVFSVNAFNLGDRLYRNHLSFIKDIAPEMGRGVRVAYTIRFY